MALDEWGPCELNDSDVAVCVCDWCGASGMWMPRDVALMANFTIDINRQDRGHWLAYLLDQATL
jgi:hypothetical protein